MSAQSESDSSLFDTVRLTGAIVLIVLGIVGYYYFSDITILYRILGLVGIMIASLGLVLSTEFGSQFLSFLREARIEVRKVVWPTKQETLQATLVVVALVFLVGTVLWLLDMVLFWGVGRITGQG